MVLLREYLRRLFGIWISWVFTGLDVLGLIVLIVIDISNPDSSLPWWLYLCVLLVTTVSGLIAANVKLFAATESENQTLKAYIAGLEDSRADIRLKVTSDLCYVPHQPSLHFALNHDEKRKLHPRSRLYKGGVPVGVVIGASLGGEKKSSEAGALVWRIAQADLPSIFVRDEENNGLIRWTQTGGAITRIDNWKDDFTAVYELPIRLAQDATPQAFAEQLKSLERYHIVIDYHTERGIESVSKTHSLILDGDFRWLQDQMCERWEEPEFRELAQIAQCP